MKNMIYSLRVYISIQLKLYFSIVTIVSRQPINLDFLLLVTDFCAFFSLFQISG